MERGRKHRQKSLTAARWTTTLPVSASLQPLHRLSRCNGKLLISRLWVPSPNLRNRCWHFPSGKCIIVGSGSGTVYRMRLWPSETRLPQTMLAKARLLWVVLRSAGAAQSRAKWMCPRRRGTLRTRRFSRLPWKTLARRHLWSSGNSGGAPSNHPVESAYLARVTYVQHSQWRTRSHKIGNWINWT